METAKSPRLSDAQSRLLFSAALAFIVAAGAWLRWSWIGHFMRYDESYSAVTLVGAGDWFNYTEPNNHVLNTLLMQLCVRLGGFTIAMLRLPAFAAGVLMIPAAAWAAFLIGGKRVGALMAAGFVAASSILVEYSVNARGYSMVCLATLLMLPISSLLGRRPKAIGLWIAWGLIAIAGLYTIPTMLQSVALMAVVMLLVGGRERFSQLIPRLLIALLLTGLITAALYLPVIKENGLRALIANRWVTPQPLSTLPSSFENLCWELIEDWSRDSSTIILFLLSAGVLLTIVKGFRERRAIWFLPLIALAVAFVFVILQRRVPPARALLYLLPVLFVSSGAALGSCWGRIANARAGRVALCALLCCACTGWGLNAWAIRHRTAMISESPETCSDIEALAKTMAGRGLYSGKIFVLPSLEISAPLLFYTYLNAPPGMRPPPNPGDPVCREFYLLQRHPGTATRDYLRTPHLSTYYKSPELVCSFPTAYVYVCERR
jgi:hypothetical protein